MREKPETDRTATQAEPATRIGEMIADLCPDGVEYKQVWQITTWDKRFNGVDRAKQPAINQSSSLLPSKGTPACIG